MGLLWERLYDMDCLYVNTSQQDLDTLHPSAVHKYHITGGEGCNKDREKSKLLVDNDYDNILYHIQNFKGKTHIVIVFSASGGTGSGAGPMLAYLLSQDPAFENVTISIVTILPSFIESYRAHSNAYFCMKEISKIPSIGSVFVLDNNRTNSDYSIFDLNREFVDNFMSFLEIPYKDKSTEANIDEAEIKAVLSAHNMAMIFSTKDIVNTTASLISELNNNKMYAPIEKDNIIQYIALSLANPSIQLNTALAELRKTLGMPLDDFKTRNKRGISICALSGLSFPVTRLEEIADTIKSHTEQASKILNASSTLDDDVVDIFASKKKRNIQPAKTVKKSRRDMLRDLFND